MLSLRGDELVLLSLRRRIYLDGKAVDAVALGPGLRVRLAPEVELVVESVGVPDAALGIEGPGLPATVLPGTCSLLLGGQPRLAPGVAPEAAAVLWPTDGQWRMRLPGQAPVEVAAGARIEVGGRVFRLISMSLASAGQQATRLDHAAPLRVVASFDTVHIHRGGSTGAGGAPLVLTGQLARVLSELATLRTPVAWTELAAAQWPAIEDRDLLRRRWDVLLVRLRERLREGGVRPDLVQSTGVGLVEIVLQDGDVVEDRT